MVANNRIGNVNFAKLDNMANKKKPSAPANNGFGNRDYYGNDRNQSGGYHKKSNVSNRSNGDFHHRQRGGFHRNDNRKEFVEKGSPSELGGEFYNPYTFIPFPEKIERKNDPSYLTADEKENRYTGVLDLTVKNLSPLLACEAEAFNKQCDSEGNEKKDIHKEYHAMTMGDDVVLPATSVRGGLRTLMTILVGGTLGYMDRHLHLCQGRDVHCGPIYEKTGEYDENHKPIMELNDRKAFLARVVKAGGYNRKGEIELGESGIFKLPKLERLLGWKKIGDLRPTTSKQRLFVDNPHNPTLCKIVKEKQTVDESLPYEIKLSGNMKQRPNSIKKEGFFKSIGNKPIELPAEFWEDYSARNKNGARPELKENDLVWVQPIDPDIESITSAQEIKSIQWARWGRCGQRFEDALGNYSCVKPDCQNPDGKVDSVTDLWGQVHLNKSTEESKAPNLKGKTFASKIRIHNLVFENESKNVETVTLAPLSMPHPGCIAMYRSGKADSVNKLSPLNGYKVYRNSLDRGENAPWLFSTQGIYEEGQLKQPKCNMNKTVDLLREGSEGRLKISFRSLSKKELAMLLLVCSVDWKLGGGKPLGLGHCRVTKLACRDEFGAEIFPALCNSDSNIPLPDDYAALICDMNISSRVEMYKDSQVPVKNLRYPRAAEGKYKEGKLGIRREALLWFERHAKPKTSGSGLGSGLVTSIINAVEYPGQVLGNMMNGNKPLYGYDLYSDKVSKVRDKGNEKNMLENARPFNPQKDIGDGVQRENNSPNAQTHQDNRNNRGF